MARDGKVIQLWHVGMLDGMPCRGLKSMQMHSYLKIHIEDMLFFAPPTNFELSPRRAISPTTPNNCAKGDPQKQETDTTAGSANDIDGALTCLPGSLT